MTMIDGGQLGYRIELIPEADGGFTALHPELPGCVAWGDTAEEAVGNLDGAREAWIFGQQKAGLELPAPFREEDASGRITLRLPQYLHHELVLVAQRESVSLNSLIMGALASFATSTHAERFFCKRHDAAESTSSVVAIPQSPPSFDNDSASAVVSSRTRVGNKRSDLRLVPTYAAGGNN